MVSDQLLAAAEAGVAATPETTATVPNIKANAATGRKVKSDRLFVTIREVARARRCITRFRYAGVERSGVGRHELGARRSSQVDKESWRRRRCNRCISRWQAAAEHAKDQLAPEPFR